jgi:hypothetical protein
MFKHNTFFRLWGLSWLSGGIFLLPGTLTEHGDQLLLIEIF